MAELVTVIVLTYKNFSRLKKNLDSIFSQDYPNIELVISDDGSENYDEDMIKKILEDKSKNIKIVKLIHHKKNLGTVKNFNNAIKKSEGEYILPLSQDDYFYDKSTISNIIMSFENNLVVSGIRTVVSKEGEFKGILPSEKEIEIIKSKKLYNYLVINGNLISGASTYYKRTVFDKYGFFDEALFLLEDMPYYLNLIRNKEKIKMLNFSTINYGCDGISSKKSPLLKKDYINLYLRESKQANGYLKRYLTYKYKKLKSSNKLNLILLNILYLEAFIFKKFIKKNAYKFI